MPVVALFAVVLTIVLRAGASRVFFDVVGSFQAGRLIADTEAHMAVVQGLMLDGMSGIFESAQLIGEQIDAVTTQTVEMAKQIGEARIEYEKFANFVGSGDVAQQIIEQGESLAFGADQALKAGAKMAQLSNILGGGAAISAATTAGMEFGLIGGMETEEAMKRMIALQQQTQFLYGDLTKAQYDRMTAEQQANVVRANTAKLMDELNTIENRSSATMAQITFVMNQFAASAKLAGDDVAYMAAMSATLIEAGEEQGKAGRALRMMYARLAADTGNNNEILEKYGITVKDAEGNLLSMKQILQQVSDIYPSLEQNHKAEIAQAMAGNDHYVRALKLMENYDRSLELEAQALDRLDTAQEEVNRKMQDNVTILRAQEEALNNAKGALGEQLLPAMIKSAKAQTNLTNGFVQLGENVAGFSQLMGSVVLIREYMGLFAPVAEANLNMMSLNVSLQTQRQIMRAISNEELVNASAYGGKVSNQAMSLAMLREEAGLKNRMAQQDIVGLKVQFDKLLQQSQLAQASNAMTVSEEMRHKQRMQSIEKEFRLEYGYANQARLLREGTNTQERARIEHKKQQLDTDKAELITNEQKLAQLRAMTQEQKVSSYVEENSLYRRFGEIKRIEVAMKNKGSVRKANLFIQEKENALLEENLRLEQSIHAVETSPDAPMVKHIQANASKQYVNSLRVEFQNLEQIHQQTLRSVLTKHQDIKATYGNTTAENILSKARERALKIMETEVNTYTKGKQITDSYKIATIQLAQAYNVNEEALNRIIMQMPMYLGFMETLDAQNQATALSKQRLNNTMMIMTGLFGSLSMIVGMFAGDNEYLQQVMSLLLIGSMIPMTFQMFTMTQATYSAAAGMVAVGAAGHTAAGGIRAMLSATGVGYIALAAIGALLAFIVPLAFATDEATESMEDLGRNTAYTASEFEKLNNELMVMDAKSIYDGMISKEQEILALKEEAKHIDDETLRTVNDQKITALEKELSIYTDIYNQRYAQAILEGEIAENTLRNMFSQAQAIADLEERQNEINEGKGILKKRRIRGKEKDIEDILADIPDEYEGAILDLMKVSEDYDDFLDRLDVFARETETGLSELGLSFTGFGEEVEGEFVGAIERAKEAMFDFNSEREELFFGMSKGNITGDMVKQVVNKGVETLINTTEVIMTNNFNGMTTNQVANEILEQVMDGLTRHGVSVQR